MLISVDHTEGCFSWESSWFLFSFLLAPFFVPWCLHPAWEPLGLGRDLPGVEPPKPGGTKILQQPPACPEPAPPRPQGHGLPPARDKKRGTKKPRGAQCQNLRCPEVVATSTDLWISWVRIQVWSEEHFIPTLLLMLGKLQGFFVYFFLWAAAAHFQHFWLKLLFPLYHCELYLGLKLTTPKRAAPTLQLWPFLVGLAPIIPIFSSNRTSLRYSDFFFARLHKSEHFK